MLQEANTLIIGFNRDDMMIISASIVKGKYDNSLPWPFTGTIVVKLLNQTEDKSHYNKEIWSGTDNPGLIMMYAGKVPAY